MISPIVELSSEDSMVANNLWVVMFPIVWAALTKEDQVGGIYYRLICGE